MSSTLSCISCGKMYSRGSQLRCKCGDLLEVKHSFHDVSADMFDSRLGTSSRPYNSGVWRFKELINPSIENQFIVSRPEGNTNLYEHKLLLKYSSLKQIAVKHEGENPTGSFKDRGMTVGMSEALASGAKIVACASTGNTSASLAAYAAQAGLKCAVFIPEGNIAFGKLAQAMAYGAKVLQVKGNFDDAMRIVQEASRELGMYLLNSVNPWRIEGQKSIIFELLQQRNWEPPDWIIVPAGNLGNTSAFGKALRETKSLGLIDKVPKLASIQAEGANPFYRLWKGEEKILDPMKPDTIASAIKIGNPVSWKKAIRSIKMTRGVVSQVNDQEIMEAKAIVDRCGIGCEPASAASLAGAKKLVSEGVISRNENVVCILTGNLLKDPEVTVKYHMGQLEGITSGYANKPKVLESDLDSVREVLGIDVLGVEV